MTIIRSRSHPRGYGGHGARPHPVRDAIGTMIDDGKTPDEIVSQLGTNREYVRKIAAEMRGKTLESLGTQSPYQSRDWFERNDRKFRAAVEKVWAEHGGW